jgi:ADP-ribosylglycohydrolase
MLGAITGDIIGSPYERYNTQNEAFPLFTRRSRFTDDTILTVAVADTLLQGGSYEDSLLRWYRQYPVPGYGKGFRAWAQAGTKPVVASFGNGCVMRVSPIGWAFPTIEETFSEAVRSSLYTHHHEESFRAVKAISGAIFIARMGGTKEDIRSLAADMFGYDLLETTEDLLSQHHFASCMASVPQAFRAFLMGKDFESTIRLAILEGGDSDSIAAMAGGIAEAFYGGLPPSISRAVWSRMARPMRTVASAFYGVYINPQSLFSTAARPNPGRPDGRRR